MRHRGNTLHVDMQKKAMAGSSHKYELMLDQPDKQT